MNEVTMIHLGRQAFTVSAAAHKQLRDYLDAIEKQVGDKDVVEEVELRMAELLNEHGVSGDKVVLVKDVDFLKGQLGEPRDFEGDEKSAEPLQLSNVSKRLFRDTDNAMLAGVASGLSAYFGVDVLLIRILFVVGAVAWGTSILLYILLWLLVPEAKTSSERLQMAGKRVTVDSLKEVVERADVKGAARRANKSLAEPINSVFRIIIKIIGIAFVVFGLGLILAILSLGAYLLFHGNVVMDNLFPVGLKEHLLVYIGFAVAGLISIFVVLIGMAIFRRKWPVRAWLTGVLVGITLIGIGAGAALAGDTAPHVRDRYNANFRTVVRNVEPFSQIQAVGQAVSVSVEPSDRYYVALRYYRGGDPSQVKTSVKNGTLLIDYQNYQWDRHCSTFCLPDTYDMSITVYTPNPSQIFYPSPAEPTVFPGSFHIYKQ